MNKKKRGFDTYDSMDRLKPDFFVHTGDYVYYDKPGPLAKNIELARHKWHAMDGWPALVNFYKNTPIYMLKDDHDLLKNDVHPGSGTYGKLTFKDGLRIWSENAPIRDKPYRTFRWARIYRFGWWKEENSDPLTPIQTVRKKRFGVRNKKSGLWIPYCLPMLLSKFCFHPLLL